MVTIGITGATGALGTLVLDELRNRGIPAADLVAFARSAEKAAGHTTAGIDVRVTDYDDASAWPAALAGVDTLLLISSTDPGKRVPQHTAVIEGAKAAGVTRVVYTSMLRAATSPNVLAPEHKATEELLGASGLAVTVLRNGWYVENYLSQLPQYLANGAIVDATDGTAINWASRADYATATAGVLTRSGHEGKTYELGGTAGTLADLAAAITEVTGTTVVEQGVSVEELRTILETQAGLPAATAAFVAALDEGAARGDLLTDTADLEGLLGRASTPLIDVVRAAV